MVLPQDVRIGNKVWWDEEKQLRYTINMGDFCSLDVFDKVEPIKLTNEILLKLGFKVEDDRISPFWKLVINRTEVISIEDDWSFGLNAANETSKQGYAGHPDLCKYLHQLQNLYYSLTGKELKIEL